MTKRSFRERRPVYDIVAATVSGSPPQVIRRSIGG